MQIILDCPEETLALHIVAITRDTWPNIKLVNVSVENLTDGNTISILPKETIGELEGGEMGCPTRGR